MTTPQPPLLGSDEGFCDLRTLDVCSNEFDRAVESSAEIDQFCSSSCWVLPAALELMPPRRAAIRRGPAGWLAFMRGEHAASGRYLEPLEASWGLACPLVGPDPLALAEWLNETLLLCRSEWDLTLLAGLPAASQLLAAVALVLSKDFRLLRHGRAGRHLASLRGGMDGFLSRRSANFRRSAVRARARAAAAGITFEHQAPRTAADALAQYARVQAVERRSWKGQAEVGIATGPFGEFYRNMVPRLAARGALHIVFARAAETDVAFLLGGVFGDTFRGLQLSFDDGYRALSLGNLCQLQALAALGPAITHYDLGSTGLEYKARWAENTVETEILIVLPR